MPDDPALDADIRPSLSETLASPPARRERLARGDSVGRYLVIEPLGEGGMGTVYSAYDPELDRKVAIKLLKRVGEDARASLLREAQAMARLAHPNVVAVHDTGSFGEGLFVAMEYVSGQTLRQWLGERPRARREVLRIFISAGEGLAAAHRAGLVHRDFKPENVLVGKDGRPRVTDFGLAHLEPATAPEDSPAARASVADDRFSIAGRFAGTPAYMAPEQWLCGATDHRTDQFSFCVALWEALCGERPFAGEDTESIRSSVLRGARRAPPRVSGVPRWLRLTLERGLAVEPRDRFPDLKTLLSKLRRERLAQAKRAAGWAAAALVLVGTGSFLAYERHLASTRCEREASAAVASLWRPASRAAVEASLRGLGRGEAPVRDTLAQIDESVGALREARAAICEAARSSGPEAQAGALRCLEQHFDRAGAALGMLSRPSPRLAQSVDLLLEELSIPPACETLRAEPRPRTEDSAELRAAAAEIQLLIALGRGASVVERVPPLLERARAAGERAVAASLQVYLAKGLSFEEGRSEKAEKALREAVRDADASGEDALSAYARISLFDHLSERMRRPGEAEELARDAEAWLERLGNPAGLRMRYCEARADLELRQGRHETALAYNREAVEWAERAYGPRSHRVAFARGNLGSRYSTLGHYSQAVAEVEAAAEIAGSAHWRSPLPVAVMWTNAAYTHLYVGRPAQALAALERAEAFFRELGDEAATWQAWGQVARAMALAGAGRGDEAALAYDRVLGSPELLDDGSRAEALAGRARLRCARGDARAALADADEALRLAQTPGTDGVILNAARFARAQALGLLGQPERAQALAREALAGFTGPEDGALRAEIERWLAAQPSAPGRDR